MKTEPKSVSLEDLAIAQDCTRHAHRLRNRADQIRADIIARRKEIAATHDVKLREMWLCGLIDAEQQAQRLEAQAAVWADEAERWENGIE